MGESKVTERGTRGGLAGSVEGEGEAAFCTGFVGICRSGVGGRGSEQPRRLPF
jgi:hypothetical protein